MEGVIDLRVRPPYKSWLNVFLFAHKEWTLPITTQMGFEPPRSYVEGSMALLLQELRESGVTHAVIPGNHALKPESVGAPSAASSAGLLEIVPNEEIHEVLQQHPDVFVAGIAAVDPSEPDALSQIEQAVREWGFRGVAIDPGLGIQPMYPDDRRLFPIYDTCLQLDVPVLIKISHQMGPDITYGHPLYLGRAASAFPKLLMVIVHGAWPYVREAIAVAQRHKNVYLQPDFYMTFPGKLEYVEAANTFLQDRLLYASGYPVLPVGGMLRYFKELPFSPEVLPKVLYQNAARLLKL